MFGEVKGAELILGVKIKSRIAWACTLGGGALFLKFYGTLWFYVYRLYTLIIANTVIFY